MSALGILRPRYPHILLAALLSLMAPQASAQTPADQPLFDFHNGLWVNLHHFLYVEAQAADPQKGSRAIALAAADSDELNRLSPEERRTWSDAVSFYAQSFLHRDLLFDRGMETIKNQLEDGETSPDLAGLTLPSGLREILLKAEPVYRRHWWPRHRDQNREWIAELQSLVTHYGAGIAGDPGPHLC